MNALQMARSAYATSAPTRPPRTVEYDAFARITERLSRAATSGTHFPALAVALTDNLRLWTLLAADVANRENSLPDSLRARIFYLADFTRTHTRKVLRNAATPEALVEINLAVMRGLRAGDDAR
ncbi:flagellar biosynthesis regulator FlaF [Palleronia sp. KMU-117]|uniref:flagellar biosynthesis regulator FlaF n=1 Tax=Palleronia sp. KMU-117 TaxID=3434108 RepID=UPI003D72ED91